MRLPFKKSKTVVSVLRLEGIILSGSRSSQSAINDQIMAPLVEKAFSKGKPAAVALAVNSPGGSAAQSSLIAARIRRLAGEKKIPVYAFVEDVAASGGYWLAVAADKIFVDESSIVGSIGVISSSFGFHELLKRSGVERRVHTAGEDKSMLDPFLPEDPKDVERLRQLQQEIHTSFIEHVRKRRGDRIVGEDLFTGRFWTGSRAVELGLADGIAHLVPKMKEEYGDKVKFKVYAKKRKLFSPFGSQVADSLVTAVENRLMWSRYGL